MLFSLFSNTFDQLQFVPLGFAKVASFTDEERGPQTRIQMYSQMGIQMASKWHPNVLTFHP